MRRRTGLAVVLALALAARVAVALLQDQELFADAFDYHRHAASIAAGDGYPPTILAEPGGATALRPPAYPHLLGLSYALFGSDPLVGRLMGAVLGTVTVLLVYLLSRGLWNDRVALVAAALAAVSPPLVMLNASLVSEALFVPLVLGTLLALVRYRESGGMPWTAAAGVLCGAAALSRSIGLVLLAPAAIATLYPRRPLGRRALAGIAVVVTTTVLTIAPWSIRNVLVFDELVPIATQDGFVIGSTYNHAAASLPGLERGTPQLAHYQPAFRHLFNRAGISEAEIDRRLRASGVDYAADHPGYAAQVTALNALRVLNLGGHDEMTAVSYREMGIPPRAAPIVTVSVYVVLVLAALAVVALARSPALRPGMSFVWLAPLLLYAGVIPVLGHPRYRTPVDPFLVMLAALALTTLADRLRDALMHRPVDPEPRVERL